MTMSDHETAGDIHVLLRADAGPSLGGGHVHRSLTLARALRSAGAQVAFAGAPGPGDLRDLCAQRGFPPLDPAEISAHAENVSLAVFDGYQFSDRDFAPFRAAGALVAAFDEGHRHARFTQDVVINSVPGFPDSFYANRLKPGGRLLCSGEFAVLRPEFAARRGKANLESRRAFVAFGSADHSRALCALPTALDEAVNNGWRFVLMVGSNCAHLDDIRGAVRRFDEAVTLLVDLEDVASEMAACSVFLGAPSQTALEACCVGLPLLLAPTVDNQAPLLDGLVEGGACLPAASVEELPGMLCSLDAGRMRDMGARASELVDGGGAQRLTRALLDAARLRPAALRLRAARVEDSEVLLSWRNDPLVYRWFFNTQPVNHEDHARWFARVLKGDGCAMYVAVFNDAEPAGVVRFDRGDAREYQVSVTVAPELHGRGLGARLIAQGTSRLLVEHPGAVAVAETLEENEASTRAFLKAGYIEQAPRTDDQGNTVRRLRFPR